MDVLAVTIWSDFTCPFCYVGLARAQWLEREHGAQVTWLPFFLHPEYPPEGLPRSDLERRYGPGVHEHTQRLVEAAGLTYNPSPRLPNTLHAHQVTELARDRGLHDPVHHRLMHGYWSEQADLGDDETLLDLASEAGLDRDEAASALAEGRYSDRLVGSTQDANRLGINAVPAFVLDNRLLVLGAQPEEAFEQAVAQLEGPS
jgi:predicted DsbA family dithiol-disulfide isomerase